MNVQTSIYQYVQVHTRTVRFVRVQKKVQTGLEPVIFCTFLAERTPALLEYRPQRRIHLESVEVGYTRHISEIY